MVWTARETHRKHQDISTLAGVLGIGFSALGLIVGTASLLISWLTYQADRREHADALSPSDIADEFAVAVRVQWEAEARVRRLNDPYPLPVSWLPADSELTEPWPVLLRITRAAPDAWPAGSDALAGMDDQIVDVFTQQVPGGRLIVLGEPGSGKTMLLVRLLLGLTGRRAAGAPVPVIFPLASWNPAEQELDAWMAHRLSTDYPGLAAGYGITNRAHALLERRLVLPLLDGFDELPPRHRAMALDSINRSLPPGHQLVLSSRLTEYRAALAPASGVPVRLIAAAGIELQPLTANDASTYLRRDAGGEGTYSAARWDLVASLLGSASPVGRALTTPLALFLARTIWVSQGR
ncbi:NACHT domain-containing protein [Streptomyces sp. NBC_00268]|uniref:NACHT domain-containing protein n=1 Tax=Streptomyces sp. NBC_00268 TaxID=2975695 RepID=UPI00224FE3F9|nr:NACHT domain-containing protein [Streptomyces sp. NBC_00268]MCX5181158.1 NACHT domain-containing protein [Streptomyces sp. NBC_00268]